MYGEHDVKVLRLLVDCFGVIVRLDLLLEVPDVDYTDLFSIVAGIMLDVIMDYGDLGELVYF